MRPFPDARRPTVDGHYLPDSKWLGAQFCSNGQETETWPPTLSEWGKVLHGEDLAAAILDRVLERGRFIQLDGPSGRTRHLKLEGVWPATAERLRFSGINGSEFLKRTVINSHTAVEQPHT